MSDEKTSIILHGARLSFAHLFVPKAFNEDQDPRFEATFLLDPSDARQAKVIKAVKREALRVAEEKWGDSIPKSLKKCYGDGDTKDYDGYAGMFYVSSSSKNRIPVVDTDGSTPLVQADGKPYSGCYVTGAISLWAMDNKWGKRINANLEAVQFVRDGEAFGAKQVVPEAIFEDLSDDSTEDGETEDDDEENFLD